MSQVNIDLLIEFNYYCVLGIQPRYGCGTEEYDTVIVVKGIIVLWGKRLPV